MVAKASQRFPEYKDYGSDGPGRWQHQNISGMERRAQFTPSSVPLGSSFPFKIRAGSGLS
jgi:hypothetical protein